MFTQFLAILLAHTKSTLLRICVGIPLLGIACQANADKIQEGVQYSGIELPQPSALQSKGMLHQNGILNVNMATNRPVDRFFGQMGLINSPHLLKFTDSIGESLKSSNFHWHLSVDGTRSSLPPSLGVDVNEMLTDIRPVAHTVWMTWRKALD